MVSEICLIIIIIIIIITKEIQLIYGQFNKGSKIRQTRHIFIMLIPLEEDPH